MELDDFTNENLNEDTSSSESFLEFSQELDFEVEESEKSITETKNLSQRNHLLRHPSRNSSSSRMGNTHKNDGFRRWLWGLEVFSLRGFPGEPFLLPPPIIRL